MTDQAFESLLANAVGGELTGPDKIRFEQLIEQSPELRREYESALATVAALKRLPGPTALHTEEAESVLAKIRESQHVDANTRIDPRTRIGPKTHIDPRTEWHPKSQWSIFRYAASVLIAFACGYGMHAYLMMQVARPASAPTVLASAGPGSAVAKSTTLEAAIVDVYRSRPRQPALVTCMAAMLRGR